ncbi:PadR family transcriptional regulator [Lentibacillus sediminis]|uniref:PadR family transcriptional regulator n=1 Tax=Lentibacillus sediminis TaxID=1940529 RepID=UPI000C1BF58D|nr:PadR family transcriptional regulator [Lentibacillus sediminis]
MKKQNHTKYAILGLLTTDCRTGYAIKQMIDQSLNHFWKISYGQIYPMLKELVEDGLATVETTSEEGKPDRKEYFLTSKGEEELRRWLETPVGEVAPEKNEMLLKLFFSRHQEKDVTIRQLEQYRQHLEERYQTYAMIEERIRSHMCAQPDAAYWLFTLDYGKRLTEAALEWCDATMRAISEG